MAGTQAAYFTGCGGRGGCFSHFFQDSPFPRQALPLRTQTQNRHFPILHAGVPARDLSLRLFAGRDSAPHSSRRASLQALLPPGHAARTSAGLR